MMRWSYLGALVASMVCVALVDRRWRLVLWADVRRGALTLAAGALFFLGWDLLAVHWGFYRRSDSSAMTGASIAPGVPVEEVVFVLFLCYVTVVLHRLLGMMVSARRGEGAWR